jgi:hypothetical protein
MNKLEKGLLLCSLLGYNVSEMEKKCSSCKEAKDISEFYKNRTKPDGIQMCCKPCTKKNNQHYYTTNREKCKEATRRWQIENRGKHVGAMRLWRIKNHEKTIEYKQQWRAKNETPTWITWCGVLARCRNPNTKDYKYYGGRGIIVCDRWDTWKGGSFSNFLADMGERPENTSIDRIDNEGNYEPDNCRWATWSEQMANRRKWNAREVTGDKTKSG